MGKNNRQRRANKRRERVRGQGAGQRRPTGGLSDRELAEILVFEVAEASAHGDEDLLEATLQRLIGFRAGGIRLASSVGMAMTGCLIRAVRTVWECGWQPADVVRAAGKRLGRAHSLMAGAMIAVEARTSAGPGVPVPEPWAEQLRQVGDGSGEPGWDDPGELRTGAMLLGLLIHLPVLPRLVPPPSEWGRGCRRTVSTPPTTVDSRMLAKVRALLAKAESTDFEEEAGALTAKAQELMARHAIDRAMISDTGVEDAPRGRRIGIDDPYAVGKANLLSAVATANRCRTVWMDGYGFSTVFGFSGDLDIVEILYTSLLVQAIRAMTAAGSVRDRAGRSRTRSFRQSFLIAFSGRIGERLRAATTAATGVAEAVHGGSLLPVLAGRNAAVDDAVTAAFPDLQPMSMRVSNEAGWVAGRVAADLAHLGPEQQLLPGIAV